MASDDNLSSDQGIAEKIAAETGEPVEKYEYDGTIPDWEDLESVEVDDVE